MNGPEHYAIAERVIGNADDHAHEQSPEWYANEMAAAQVHATLALTAATIESRVHNADNTQTFTHTLGAWEEVTS